MNNYIKFGMKLIVSFVMALFICLVTLFDLSKLNEGGVFNIYIKYGINAIKNSVPFLGISFIVIFLLFCYFIFLKIRVMKGLVGISFLFGVCQTASLYMYYFDSIFGVINNRKFFVYNIFSVIAYASIFYLVGSIVIKVLEKAKTSVVGSNRYLALWDKHIGVLSFGIIMLGWLPWMLIFYPGSMWYDMCYQLEQYYGYASYDLHPIFVTLIMGKCMDIGKIIFHSDDMGVFLYILLQANVCGYIYSRVVVWINKKRLPRILEVLALCYYAFLPVFGSVSQYGVKDVMTYGLFTLFLLQTINNYDICILNHSKLSFKQVVAYLVCAILCSLYRKEMIIVCCCVLLSFFIYWLWEKDRKKMFTYLVLTIILCISYKGFDAVVVNKYLGTELHRGYGSTEALSIPLQQVARFIYFHSDLVSSEEKAILDKCYTYGYDEIADNYNPYLSDPIKYNFNTNVEGFWKVYVSFLVKSPATYIESIIANSFGYYSITPPLPTTIHGAPTNGTPGDRYLYYINRDPDLNNNIVNVSYSNATWQARAKLVEYVYAWRDIPVLCLFYSFGSYTWFIILLIYFNLRFSKSLTNMLAFIPTLLIILVCIASPVNDCLRYFVSIIASVPVLLSWSVYLQRD